MLAVFLTSDSSFIVRKFVKTLSLVHIPGVCEKVDSLYSSILFFPLGSFCFVSVNAHLPMMSECCSK